MSDPIFDPEFFASAPRHYELARDFLSEMIAQEIEQKLKDHDREFSRIAVIGADHADWPSRLGFDADHYKPRDEIAFLRQDYDLILHLGALHAMNDVVGQMIQARHALAKDGAFLAAFLGGESLTELRQSMLAADLALYNGAAPRIAPMIDIRDAGGLLSRAGLALPVADNWQMRARYQDSFALFRDLRQLGLSNPLSSRRARPASRALFQAIDTHYRENTACEEGGVYASFELIFLTAYKPSETQPKPLRPGSIQLPLSEAIKRAKDEI